MIREATIDDAEAIARVHVDSWRWAYRGLLPDELLDSLSVSERKLQWQVLAVSPPPGGGVWVAVADGCIVGFACGGWSRDEDLPAGAWELHALYLQRDASGRGHGRALLERCMAEARSRGAVEVTLWVLATNERARRFYERAGFGPDSRAPCRACVRDHGTAVRLRAGLGPTPSDAGGGAAAPGAAGPPSAC